MADGTKRTSARRAEYIDPRRRLAALVRRIQALTAERRQLEARRASAQELAANERLLERLRWQLAHAARRAANGEPLTAA